MKLKMSVRQVGMLIAISIISLKILFLPAVAYRIAFNNSYISFILYSIFDLSIGALILCFVIKNNKYTINEYLKIKFGKIVSFIIMFILFIYFFAIGMTVLKEAHNFFNEVLFDFLDWEFFVIPLILIIGFMLSKSFRALGRTMELLFYLLVLGIVITIIVPINEIDISALLPFMQDGASPIFEAMRTMSFSFGDYLLLLVFMGNIKMEKQTFKKIFSYSLFGEIFVILFNIIFIALYSELSLNEELAIADIPQFAQLGQLQWISIIIWTFSLIIQIGLIFKSSQYCFRCTFNFKHRQVYDYTILIAIIISIFLLYLNLALVIKIVTSNPFFIFCQIVQVVIPIIILLSLLFKRRNNEKFNSQSYQK